MADIAFGKDNIVMRLGELKRELSYREKEYQIASILDPELATLQALEMPMKVLEKKIVLFSSAVKGRSDSRRNVCKGMGY